MWENQGFPCRWASWDCPRCAGWNLSIARCLFIFVGDRLWLGKKHEINTGFSELKIGNMWGNGQTWSKNDTYAIMTWHYLLDEIGLEIQSSVKTYQGVYHLSRMNRNLVIPENNTYMTPTSVKKTSRLIICGTSTNPFRLAFKYNIPHFQIFHVVRPPWFQMPFMK